MPNMLAEKPSTRTVQSKSIKTRPVKKKQLPPGQKLLLRLFLGAAVAFVLILTEIGAQHWGNGSATTGAVRQEVAVAPPVISLIYPLNNLDEKIGIAADLKDLRTGVFAYDPASGKYVDHNGQDEFSAASMIKVPVFVAMLQALDKGEVNLDQLVEIRQDLITGGSGWLQWRPVGSKLTLRDVAQFMITISDNTATNMIIDLLGGKEMINRSFVEWGLKKTRINNMLGDFEGTNKISPYDMVYLLARIDRGELLSKDSRDFMYKTMERTHIRTLLNIGLPAGAKIAHKTGDIGTMVGDAGIITTKEGKRFIVSVQVERPFNDRRANLLIRALSKMICRCFNSDSTDCACVGVEPLESLTGRPAHPRHHRKHHR